MGRPAILLVLSVLAFAGCGGDDDDEPAVEAATQRQAETASAPAGPTGEAADTLETFLTALAGGDAATACGLLSARGRTLVEEGALIGSPPGGGACEEVIVESYDSPGPELVEGFDVVGEERQTDGSVRLRFVNADTPVTGAAASVLRRESGQWRVDSAGMPGR